MDKDKLLAALYAMQSGEKEARHFHDELETLITLVINAKDEDVIAAWDDLCTDKKSAV